MVFVANAWQGLNQGHADSLENLGISDARSLEDERSAIGAGRNDDHLLSSHSLLVVAWLLHWFEHRLEFGVRLELDSNSSLVLVDQNANDLAFNQNMEVRIAATLELRMNESVSRIYEQSQYKAV